MIAPRRYFHILDATSVAASASAQLSVDKAKMDFREKKLYHQIHPLKLATDVGSALIFLFFLWHHRIAAALVVGFVPPLIISAPMMLRPPDLNRLKNSALGKYISKYMTPTIEVIRLLSLVLMARGAWVHNFWLIALGIVILLLAWCNGLIVRVRT